MTVRYQPDYAGTGRILRSPEMLAMVSEVGEKALKHAIEISPVGGPGDHHRGEDRAAWRLETSSHGGPRANRAEAQVINDAADRVLADVVDGHDVPALVLGYLEADGAL